MFCACREIDNYEAPGAAIRGKIVDLNTKELIPAQAPDGAIIRMYEVPSTQPINFSCRLDGTFVNEKVFAGKYKVIPVGPFITKATDTALVDIPTGKDLVFEVESFLTITANAVLSGNKVDVKFTIKKSPNWTERLARYTVVYSHSVNVDVNNYISRYLVNTEEMDEKNLLDKELSFVVENVQTDRPICIRVGARTLGTSYYNYSSIIELN